MESADPPPSIEIGLANPNRYREVRLRQVRPWLTDLVAELAPEAVSLGVLFTSDRRMRQIHREYRQRDRPTDVLSFPGEAGLEGWHLGDICISVPTARRQAEGAGHSVERELSTLLLHGVLHCLGYDHETDDGGMERLERRLRRKWVNDG